MSGSQYDHYNDETVKTRHANTALIMIDGKVVARIAGLNVREDGGTDGSYVVGDAKPKEHIHNRWSCSGDIQLFVWRESEMGEWNIGQRGLLNLRTFDIMVQDTVDNADLFKVTGCTLSGRSMGINANQRLMQQVQFLGLDLVDAEDGASTNGKPQGRMRTLNANGDNALAGMSIEDLPGMEELVDGGQALEPVAGDPGTSPGPGPVIG